MFSQFQNKLKFLGHIYVVIYKYFKFGPVWNFIVWLYRAVSANQNAL